MIRTVHAARDGRLHASIVPFDANRLRPVAAVPTFHLHDDEAALRVHCKQVCCAADLAFAMTDRTLRDDRSEAELRKCIVQKPRQTIRFAERGGRPSGSDQPLELRVDGAAASTPALFAGPRPSRIAAVPR